MGAVAEALERSLVSVDFKAVHGADQRDLESEAGARREPAPSPDVWAILFVHRLVVIRGIFWASGYNQDSGLERRDLGGGSAGVVLALAELVAEFDNPRHRKALIEGTEWLANSKPVWYRPARALCWRVTA